MSGWILSLSIKRENVNAIFALFQRKRLFLERSYEPTCEFHSPVAPAASLCWFLSCDNRYAVPALPGEMTGSIPGLVQ